MGGLLTGAVEKVAQVTDKYALESGLDFMDRHMGGDGSWLSKELKAVKETSNKLLGPELERIKKLPAATPAQKTANFADAELSKRISSITASDTHFGRRDALARLALDNIGKSQGIAQKKYAQQLFEHYMGRPIGGHIGDVAGLHQSSGEVAVKNLQVLQKLSLAFVSHLGQSLNQVMAFGLSDATKAFFDAAGEYTGGRQELSLRSGATVAKAFDELRKAAQPETWLAKTTGVVMKPLDFLSDFQNRWAAYSGEHALHDAVASLRSNPRDKTALRMLTMLSDTNAAPRIVGSGPTQQDVLLAMQRAKEIAQPETSVASVPGPWRTSPTGRLMTMFKPFVFKQARFLKQHVFDEAFKYHNFKPLMYFSLLYPTFGEINQDIRTLSRTGSLGQMMGTEKPNDPMTRPSFEHPISRIIDGMSQMGGLAIFNDTVQALGGSSSNWLTSFIFGPLVSDTLKYGDEFVVPASQMASRASRGLNTHNPYRKLGRNAEKEVLGAVPFVGSILKRDYKPVKQHPGLLKSGVIDKALGTEIQ